MKVKPQVNGTALKKKEKSNIKGPNSPDGIQNKGISKKKQKALLKKGNKTNIKLLTGNDGATKGNTQVTDITLNKFPAATKVDGQLKKKNKKKKSKAVKQLAKEPAVVEEEESDVPESPTFGINDTITNSENESPAGKKNKKNKKKNKQQKLEQNQSNKTEEESSDDEDYEEDTTIFVGNLPKTVRKVEIQNFFKKYGKVKKIRLRSVAPSDQRIPKKVAAIKRDFHKDSDSLNAFVTFEERFEARDALITNGSIFNGHHIRVNYAVSGKEHNNKVAIFVGNLPFGVRDDELWEAFENCGEIESVRVIRDKDTRIGKGFGYVNFKSPDGVELALQMENVKIQNRKLRIARAADPKTGQQKNQENITKKRKISSSLNEVSPDKVTKKKKTQEVSENESDETQESKKKKFQGEKSAERRLKKQSLKKKIKKMRNEKHKKSVASLLTSNSRKDFAEKKKNKKT